MSDLFEVFFRIAMTVGFAVKGALVGGSVNPALLKSWKTPNTFTRNSSFSSESKSN
jgi:hypothetical protein